MSYLGHNIIPVTVKKRNGSIVKYSVLSRNVLHKTKVQSRSPQEIREVLVKSGAIKAA